MQKLTAKKILQFRRLSKNRKQTFVNNLKKPAVKSDSGGDYWISCISAITTACKENDNKLIIEKIDFLTGQMNRTSSKRTKDMYQRNIDILTRFKDYDFTKLKPKNVTEFKNKPNNKHLLSIKELSIQVFPNHVFTYKNNQTEEVGAIWFVAQLSGFKNDELEVFSELLNKYLLAIYSKKQSINPNFCIVMDVVNQTDLKYSKLTRSGAESILNSTITEIKTFLK